MFWNRRADDNTAHYDTNLVDFADARPSHWGKLLAYGAAVAVGVGAIGSLGITGPAPALGANLCAAGAVPATHVVVFVDHTDEYSANQRSALRGSLQAHLRELRLGERLTVYELTPEASAPAKLLYDRCRPKTAAEADPLTENARLIGKAFHEQFEQPLQHVLGTLRQAKSSKTSPLLEALHAIGHDTPLTEPAARRVVEIWSDMLARSEIVDQHRPNYRFDDLLRGKSLYLNVPALRGSEVHIHQLVNPYARYQNAEHARFWAQYFDQVGVAAVTVQRL
jgi:hypothetical protein